MLSVSVHYAGEIVLLKQLPIELEPRPVACRACQVGRVTPESGRDATAAKNYIAVFGCLEQFGARHSKNEFYQRSLITSRAGPGWFDRDLKRTHIAQAGLLSLASLPTLRRGCDTPVGVLGPALAAETLADSSVAVAIKTRNVSKNVGVTVV